MLFASLESLKGIKDRFTKQGFISPCFVLLMIDSLIFVLMVSVPLSSFAIVVCLEC